MEELMKPYKTLAVGIIAVVALWAGFAAGQSKPSCDQMKTASPQKVEGRVVQVDAASGKVAVAAADGKTHEFQASKETLKDLKVGDKIEANLRSLPSC
jgi:hypothetical protein